MNKTNIILIIFLSILLSSCKSAHVDEQNDIAIDEVKEQKYSTIIDGLKNYYVQDIVHSLQGNHVDEVLSELQGTNKTYQDYQKDSMCFYQAITDIYRSETSIIKYLFKFKQDTGYKKIKLFYFNPDNRSSNSHIREEWIYELEFYRKMNNISLTLILNYYINTKQETIKLLLDALYIDKKSIKTERLYKKLDKIFEKYGYEDKERIRKAILEDFGKCITLDGM